MHRRQVLRWLRTGAAIAAGWPVLRDSRARAATPSRPRFYLQIIPQGGMDAVYTTDPKKLGEVENGIDVPFGPGDIIEVNGTRLGPSFRRLAPWMPRLAIVNAFRQNSANHVSGLSHITRCKSTATDGTPTLLDILGARRQDEATGAISIGAGFATAFSPGYLGAPSEAVFGVRPGLFEHLDRAEPDDLAALARALRRDAESCSGARASTAERATASNLRETAELFARVAVAPKFAPVEWAHTHEGDYHNGSDLQRALWLFENRLARCVTVYVGKQDFDTHFWNTTIQPAMAEYLACLLDKLLAELDHRMVEGRPLSRQTVMIVGSEIGRFPRLNAAHGKDHFPQVPHLFYGPGIVTGASYGATGPNMASVPVSLASGRPERGGHLLRVDDIGTTLLELDGANPEHHGYSGEHMRFLTEA